MLLSLPLQLVFPTQIYNTVVLISTVKGFNVMAHGLYPRKKIGGRLIVLWSGKLLRFIP